MRRGAAAPTKLPIVYRDKISSDRFDLRQFATTRGKRGLKAVQNDLFAGATLTLASELAPTKLFPGWQRLFTHGRGATTLSFYLQSNVSFGEGCPASDCNTAGRLCNPGSWESKTG